MDTLEQDTDNGLEVEYDSQDTEKSEKEEHMPEVMRWPVVLGRVQPGSS